MEKEQRNAIQRAVKEARNLLEGDFGSQLLEVFDIDVAKARVADGPGSHLDGEQRFLRSKLTAAIAHKQAAGNDLKEALLLFRREMAFTALNRFVALKLMEARALVHECVSQGLQSSGFEEFTGLAPALLADPEGSYQLFLQCLFEDVSREVKVLFDPRDPASLLWPRRAALLELLEILNRPELAELWSEDETIGWVYQYFNSKEERQEMRKAAAPRNSRELAVRNQFFTPRYVVEFLTDNTLGRLWYEMRRGETSLRKRCRYLVRRPNEFFLRPGEQAPESEAKGHSGDKALSQEELFLQQVHIPHRPLKDPREIRMLDPACGSMHFGLYAFDLYQAIYEEAWDIAQGNDAVEKAAPSFAPFVAYAATFADRPAFLREVPCLILKHSIHGVDIDPRAAQIAGLSLWLRAQRGWQQLGVEAADRPPIRRSNVVCAEPMPGEKELLREFVEEQFPPTEQPAFAFLLEKVFDCMALAGEAGSLLRIEEEIRTAIAEAKCLWRQGPHYEQPGLFTEFTRPEDQGSLHLDLSGITDQMFWEQVEQRIYEALAAYSHRVQNGRGFRRRLFVDDTVQGFAFIDSCRTRYDVALMNPPFGFPTTMSSAHLRSAYGEAAGNILCAFTKRALQFCPNGIIGGITDSGWLKKGDYESHREYLLSDARCVDTVVDLGWGVLDDANVAACCFTAREPSINSACILAVRAVDEHPEKKCDVLLNSLNNLDFSGEGGPSKRLFARERSFFEVFPGKSIAYEVRDAHVKAFKSWTRLEPNWATTRRGYTPGDTFRFFRCWWEVPESTRGSKWLTLNNGGSFSSVTGDGITYVAKFEIDWSSYRPLGGFRLESEDWFGISGIGWGKRTEYMYAYPLPSGSMFSNEGHCAFPSEDRFTWPLLAYLNSSLCNELLGLYSGQHKFAGYVAELPTPDLDCQQLQQAGDIARSFCYKINNVRRRVETSECFFAPIQLGESLADIENEIADAVGKVDCELWQIDSLVHQALGVGVGSCDNRPRPQQAIAKDLISINWAKALISYAIGVLFGRWDLDACSLRGNSVEALSPFASYYVFSPGRLRDSTSGLASGAGEESGLPSRVRPSEILIFDQTEQSEFCSKIADMLNSILPHDLINSNFNSDDWISIPALFNYLQGPSDFFADHLTLYTKSRRKAPIYWLLSTGNGNYSVLLYYHHFTADTLYRVVQDYVDPRISQAERDCFKWQQQVASGGTTDAAQQLQSSQALLEDLKQLKAEISLVAPLWKPDLNDGVIINHAILWRITPYAPWQKKVKECWDKLVDEEYDWAHLAFHLWPERVIPKCATDRSLAIAHGLDATFWRENQQGKWEPIPHSEEQLAQVVAAHTNHARRNDLQRFLAAPPPVAVSRARTPLFAKSASSGTRRSPRTTQSLDPELIRQVRLVLTAGPPEGMAKATIAELCATEDAQLTAVIKQLKESGQIEQLGQKRGARYRLSPAGLAATEAEGGMG